MSCAFNHFDYVLLYFLGDVKEPLPNPKKIGWAPNKKIKKRRRTSRDTGFQSANCGAQQLAHAEEHDGQPLCRMRAAGPVGEWRGVPRGASPCGGQGSRNYWGIILCFFFLIFQVSGVIRVVSWVKEGALSDDVIRFFHKKLQLSVFLKM